MHAFAVLALHLLAAAPAAEPANDLLLTDCLVVSGVGRHGRSSLPVDAIEAEIVAGRWVAPRPGDRVTLPDNNTRTWDVATAKDGVLDRPATAGGYVYWKVPADAPRTMLLEASGHPMVYVNGEPRAGDTYANGILRLPVSLRKGDNDFLFQYGRGRLQAKLASPAREALLDLRDATLPDLLSGDESQPWAAVVVINASARPLGPVVIRAARPGAEPVTTAGPTVLPYSTRKVGFRLPAAPSAAGESVPIELQLATREMDSLDIAKLNVRLRRPDQSHRRTFVSDIDGSVQYFAVNPASAHPKDAPAPALVLTLHGASVEGQGQADAYGPKPWCHLVAPTNRRPYGFDWEDWGRLDALEVLAVARKQLGTDPRRTYLTGHSMGGHGAWQLGATYPDHWAAVAPSAGWISFWTYAGGQRPEKPDAMQAMLLRAVAPSDTATLAINHGQHGVYVLHGDADDNVPVGQARAMRKRLGEFHPDFVYYERPGAGHWWGNECVDWPPLFDFLSRHTLPRPQEVSHVDFVTASPGVSERCHWAAVVGQIHALQPSTIHLRCEADKRRFSGTTDNVSRLEIDLGHLPPSKPVTLELDGQRLDAIAWPEGKPAVFLRRDGDKWAATPPPPASDKGPHRYGLFKDAFRNRMVFVYGTQGSPEENAWAFAKARYDAETFWYRGNGSIDVVTDRDFDVAKERDRNVILYGHADSNAAWKPLLGESPVQARRGIIDVGGRQLTGDDLACVFVRPRPGSERASVGVVTGSGVKGLRLTERLPYFVSGCGYPDLLVLGPETLATSSGGVRAAGFFGMDWTIATGDFIWAKEPR